ncbi:hypothetical protein BDFG_02976 [Blastomyces dermatitidis ATCC 26199]|nr:hypothetical protein BDFG_02976 [Blastomyces dermatitidis ATCC 26199]
MQWLCWQVETPMERERKGMQAQSYQVLHMLRPYHHIHSEHESAHDRNAMQRPAPACFGCITDSAHLLMSGMVYPGPREREKKKETFLHGIPPIRRPK